MLRTSLCCNPVGVALQGHQGMRCACFLLAQAGHGAGACLNRLPRLCCDRLGVQHLPLHCPAPPEGTGLQWHDSRFIRVPYLRDSPHKVCNRDSLTVCCYLAIFQAQDKV